MINPISSHVNMLNLNASAGAAPAQPAGIPMNQAAQSSGITPRASSPQQGAELLRSLASAESTLASPGSGMSTQAVAQQWSTRLWTGGS